MKFEAGGQSTQYNAPHGTINVSHHHAEAPAPPVPRRPWMAPPLASGMVARPEVSGPLVEQVCGGGAEPVPVTGVHGTGGFGKTTLAVWLCHQPAVRERFPGGLLWTTIGEHVAGADLATRVNDLIEQLTGQRPTLTNPIQAGFRLGEVLDAHPDPVLLVVDDVWAEHQLEPFRYGGARCRRLVTTRNRWVLPPGATTLRVDEMTQAQAAALLTRGVADPAAELVDRVLVHTGRWPIALALANRALVKNVAYGTDPTRALHRILDRLADEGPTAFDVDDARHQRQAVAATVRAGLDLLPPDTADRLTELAVFAEDTDIPLSVLELLWGATGRLTASGVERVCEALADLSLVLDYRPDPGFLRLHDVIRAYLVHTAGPARLEALHARLLDAAGAALAALTASEAAGAWWTLPPRLDYLVEHLTRHLAAAGRHAEIDSLVTDLRWVETRLRRHGPAGVEADLAHANGATVVALVRFIRQAGHLLAPIEPPYALGAVLASRLDGIDELKPLLDAYTPTLALPRLANRRPPPDQAHPALMRTLAGHGDSVLAVAVAPDGTWLASGSMDHTARVWDAATGDCRHVLTGHTDDVTAVAIAPDGTWLVTGSDDATVRIWDPATGECRRVLDGHEAKVYALAIAPDGTWVASGGHDDEIRIWDTATGECRHALRVQTDMLGAMALGDDGLLVSGSYDGTITVTDPVAGEVHRFPVGTPITTVALDAAGTWLVTDGLDNLVRLWNLHTGQRATLLRDDARLSRPVAIAADATWCAAGGDDVRIWDVSTGELRHRGAATDRVTRLLAAPDGSWLAAGGSDELRIWDPMTGHAGDPLTGHTAAVLAMAPAPDGTWLATASADRTVRIWNPRGAASDRAGAGITGSVHTRAAAPDGTWLVTVGVAEVPHIWDPASDSYLPAPIHPDRPIQHAVFAPDGTWLATVENFKHVTIWDLPTGSRRHALGGDVEAVRPLAAAPDARWLATGDTAGRVRIWDPADGALRQTLAGAVGTVESMAVAPDGSWLAAQDYYWNLLVWDVATGARRFRRTGAGSLAGVAPDGRWVAACDRGDHAVRLYDSDTGECVLTLAGHTGGVGRAVVAPDGTWLATAGSDGTIRIWDLATGATRHVLTGHDGLVSGLALSRDATRLASAGFDQTVRIWDPATGAPLAAMRVGAARVWGCRWLPGDRAVMTGGLRHPYVFDLLG